MMLNWFLSGGFTLEPMGESERGMDKERLFVLGVSDIGASIVGMLMYEY